MNRISLPIRTEFGFQRTTCSCELCSFWCRIMPGFLVPSDLQRLCPPGADLMAWAKEHLRASQGFRLVNPMTGAMLQIPSLVPAKDANGHCHWLQSDGRCGVHENSPFGCAFVDQHMKDKDADKRNEAGRLARMEDFATNGPYSQPLSKTDIINGGNMEKYILDESDAFNEAVKQYCRICALTGSTYQEPSWDYSEVDYSNKTVYLRNVQGDIGKVVLDENGVRCYPNKEEPK